ncbi:MAG: transglutaminase-like domain-containing protein, partial [Myxococcota bacterium]|nr:transglutaminase-like domain-containing protein [Myxococcota bacterium]
DVYSLPYFDPVTLAQAQMEIRVLSTEILPNGEEAYWLERTFSGATTRSLVMPSGDLLREEGALGIAMVRQTPEEARSMPTGGAPVDIIAISAVPLRGKIASPGNLSRLSLRVEGVDVERVMKSPPIQDVEGDVVSTWSPDWSALPDAPIRETDPELAEYLSATPFLPIKDLRIVEQANKVVAGIGKRKLAVKALVDWVHGYLVKAPTVGVPNALEVLEVGQGDCNEHTALFVGLARAAGIPARIAAGVVYSTRILPGGSFYYHAWPEVYFGEEGGWIPVDPTLGQYPADPTHIKLVEGDLARQIEIMGVLGQLGFELVDSEEKGGPEKEGAN